MIELDEDNAEYAQGVDEEPLFAVTRDGERVVYTIPVKFPASWGLRFLHFTTVRGLDSAALWLAGRALGSDGYEALLDSKALTDSQKNEIINTIMERAMGKEELQSSGEEESNS